MHHGKFRASFALPIDISKLNFVDHYAIQTVSRDTGAELIFLEETRVQSLEFAVE